MATESRFVPTQVQVRRRTGNWEYTDETLTLHCETTASPHFVISPYVTADLRFGDAFVLIHVPTGRWTYHHWTDEVTTHVLRRTAEILAASDLDWANVPTTGVEQRPFHAAFIAAQEQAIRDERKEFETGARPVTVNLPEEVPGA